MFLIVSVILSLSKDLFSLYIYTEKGFFDFTQLLRDILLSNLHYLDAKSAIGKVEYAE